MGSDHSIRLRSTQVLGLCFYWAWVYLSFNNTVSMNWKLDGSPSLLWVHLSSMLVGVITYALIIVFSRRAERLLSQRRILILSGVLCALGTACYVVPAWGNILWLQLLGGVVTGVSTPGILLFWGVLYSDLSARDIVIATAASFLAANIIYFGTSLLSGPLVAVITIAMPLCSALLFPDDATVERCFGTSAKRDTRTTLSQGDKVLERVFPIHKLPWRIAVGLFVLMFVYGGVRILLGTLDTSKTDSSYMTALLILGVTVAFMVWGYFFKGREVSLGYAYKLALPLLGTVLLMIVLFGQEYVAQLSLLATACNVTIEMLTWMLLADIARTTKTPAFLVFALGRAAVQLGMFGGQIIAWYSLGSMNIFSIGSVILLMLVSGFMFREEDTVLVFEPPTSSELEHLQAVSGQTLEDRLTEIATTHDLSPRETEIFIYWATGHGSNYIQDKLVISQATVKTHVRHIYEKCGVHSRAEIIALLEQK